MSAKVLANQNVAALQLQSDLQNFDLVLKKGTACNHRGVWFLAEAMHMIEHNIIGQFQFVSDQVPKHVL